MQSTASTIGDNVVRPEGAESTAFNTAFNMIIFAITLRSTRIQYTQGVLNTGGGGGTHADIRFPPPRVKHAFLRMSKPYTWHVPLGSSEHLTRPTPTNIRVYIAHQRRTPPTCNKCRRVAQHGSGCLSCTQEAATHDR